MNADHAWKALGLVNEWVRHAEAKAGATLAAAGVTGGVLYNLVKDQTEPGAFLAVSATACGVFVVLTGLLAVISLSPRLRAREEPTSAVYFEHIARGHPASHHGYVTQLRRLVSTPEELVDQLGHQVWANARVAKRKYWWASLAIWTLVLAVMALAAAAARLALLSIGVWDGQ